MKPLEQKTATVSAPRAAVKGAHWLKPKLVAEIAYTEETTDGVLRHPSYLGLRDDKKPEAVVVEKAKPVRSVAAKNKSVTITNRDRVLFPESGVTKGALADYYVAVAEIMLPWTVGAADFPHPLPARPREEMLLPETRRWQLWR